MTNGKSVGGVAIDGPTGVTPAVRGDYVYFGTHEGSFYSVNWKEVDVQWEVKPSKRAAPFRSSPAVTDKVAVVGCRGKRIFAINLEDGSNKLEFTTKRNVDSSPVIVGDRAFDKRHYPSAVV